MNILRGIVSAVGILSLVFTSSLFADNALRLGWQVPWATQGQLVMGLKHTNIPELNDLDIEYAGFSFGGPLNKAALGGEVDILLTADQPALVLLSRNPDFRIVARMMYNRVCIYVPVESPIQTLDQLAGMRVLGPVGAAAERVALAALDGAGVDISEVKIGNLDMAQQSALLSRSGSRSEWTGADALFGFDPLPAVFKEQGKARMLHCGKVVSVVVATREMVEQRSDELARFLRAFRMSWHYFANNPGIVNPLFSRESRLDVSDAVLDEAASIEPNRWAGDWRQHRLDFVDEDFDKFAETNDFLIQRGVISQPVDVRKFISTDALAESAGNLTQADLARIEAR